MSIRSARLSVTPSTASVSLEVLTWPLNIREQFWDPAVDRIAVSLQVVH
jgi:hypothetical protein